MKINVQTLIKIFQQMYAEHWSYKWGSHEQGCVDCSGAFTYAFGLYGIYFPNGSNTIARKYIAGELLPISEAKPGMAAFKCRPWSEKEKDNKWYNTEPGDVYHIGLVDDDPKYVLNAKGEKSGFSRDKIDSWDYVAYLKDVDYEGSEEDHMKTATVVRTANSTGNTVNMRYAPSTSAKLVERVPFGSVVEVLADSGEWCKIRWESYEGWMLSNYLEYDGQADETIPGGMDNEMYLRIEAQLKDICESVEVIRDVIGRG